MNRRKFLKLLFASLASLFIVPLFATSKALPRKVLIAIKKGKYPGKIKQINNISLAKPAKWLG